MIIEFVNGLGVEQFLSFSSKSEVVLFDLWKFGKDSTGKAYIFEKDHTGGWIKKDFTDCNISLCLDKGEIALPEINPVNIDDMSNFEYKLSMWTANFREAVTAKLKQLYSTLYGNRNSKKVDESLEYFVTQVIKRTNYEDYGIKVYQLHNFFNDFFSNEHSHRILSNVNEKATVCNVVNLYVHRDALNTFLKYLPRHFALLRLVDGQELIRHMEETTFISQREFVSFVLKSIDSVVSYTNDDYDFLLNLSSESLCAFIAERENFILWFKLFSDVSNNCCFENIDALYRTFIRIGLKQCLKNKPYVKKIFAYFQRKQFQDNTYDLTYALNYGVIDNCLNWKIKSTKKIDNFINDFAESIIAIRKTEIIHHFVKLSDEGILCLTSGHVVCEKTKELWENCLILCGLCHTDQECQGLSFTVYKDGDHSVLLGGQVGFGQKTTLYMEALVEGGNKGGNKGGNGCYLYQHCERYFHQVMRA